MKTPFKMTVGCNWHMFFAALAVFALAMCCPVHAAPGDLDPSFDGDGRVTTNIGAIGNTQEAGYASVLQADGKIIIAGSVATNEGDFALLRLKVDGSPDPTFGHEGAVVTDFGGVDGAYSVALQSDGKIVAAGYNQSHFNNPRFALARYRTDGSLDPTFGAGGKLTIDVAQGYATAYDVAIQSDGKIVVGGSAWPGGGGIVYKDFALVRLLDNGALDTSFGTGGKALTNFAGNTDEIYGIAVQGNGKIVAAGYANLSNSRNSFAVARYNPNGSLDTAFGTSGKVLLDFGSNYNMAQDVALQRDGRIVLAGSATGSSSGGTPDFALARLNLNGSLDGAFGTAGKVLTTFTLDSGYLNDSAHSVAVQSDGKIVAAGTTDGGPVSDFALVRYLSNGTVDTTFGTDGKVHTPLTQFRDDVIENVVIQSDGRILVVGYADDGRDMAAARYMPTGSLDSNFGSNGTTIPALSRGSEDVNKVLVQHDGKIVAVGESYLGYTVARYKSDGSLDPSFGLNGIAGADFGDENERIHGTVTSAALQADGKIVVVGYAMPIGFFYYALMRFNPDGSLDDTFGEGGKLLYRAALEAYAHDVAILPDGKIVVVGDGNDNSQQIYTLARFKPDGSPDYFPVQRPDGDDGANAGYFAVAAQPDGKVLLAGARGLVQRVRPNGTNDTDFGRKGFAIAPVGVVRSIAVQPDGKIVVSGTGGNNDFTVVRLNANGTLDAGFGTNGMTNVDFGGKDNAYALALLPSGRIVAAGSTDVNGNADFALAVLNTSGTIDTTFGSGGKVVTPFGTLGSDGENPAYSIAVQANGSIVAAGYTEPLFDADFALARYFGEPPTTMISIDDAEVVEGDSNNKTLVFHASLSVPSAQKVTVQYATRVPSLNAATPGVDYTALSLATLTFLPGQTNKLIVVPILGDKLDEASENLLVILSSPTGATIADPEGLGTILDDDEPPSVSITGQTIKEGNSGQVPVTFNIRLSAPSGKTVTVKCQSRNDTATAGIDYTAVQLTLLTFAPGETTKQITTQVKSDTTVELDERFLLDLTSATNVTIARSSAFGVIVNDDGPSLAIDNAKTVTEGNSGATPQVFTVHLSAASPDTVTVSWATENNTAGVFDFVAASGTLTFAPGETAKTITVQVKGDTLVESAETYKVTLSDPSYAVLSDSQAIGYIRDDDSAPLFDDKPSG